MPKVHELLAVEMTLKSQADKVRGELRHTFEKKRHLFDEKIVRYTPFAEGAQPTVEEQRDINTTVHKELAWMADIVSRAIDTNYQLAVANTTAKADLVLEDGTTMLKDVPSLALLELEKRTSDLRELLLAVPTLDPMKGFVPDPARGRDIYRSRLETKQRTQKTPKPVVLAPATKEHPAQVQLIYEDIPVGTIETQEWSGMITPTEKADMITRLESLQRAIKKARSRANDVPLADDKPEVAKKLFAYVFGF